MKLPKKGRRKIYKFLVKKSFITLPLKIGDTPEIITDAS